jgi:hypothetical protein
MGGEGVGRSWIFMEWWRCWGSYGHIRKAFWGRGWNELDCALIGVLS